MTKYLSLTAILDETPYVVTRITAPWLGIYLLTNIPLRLFQANFFRELFELGNTAIYYGYYLESLSLFVCISFSIAIYGKSVLIRSCFLTLQSGSNVGLEAFKTNPVQLVNFLYMSLLIEVLLYLLIVVFYISIPLFFLLSGLACVTAYRTERPGIIEPIRMLCANVTNIKVIIGLMFVYFVAFVVVFINLYVLLLVIIWAAGGVIGLDLARWEYVFRPIGMFPVPAELMVRLICVAGTLLIIEPFFLISLASYVHRSKLSETGEDLSLWFEKLNRVK